MWTGQEEEKCAVDVYQENKRKRREMAGIYRPEA